MQPTSDVISAQPTLILDPSAPFKAGQSFQICVQLMNCSKIDQEIEICPITVWVVTTPQFEVKENTKQLVLPLNGGNSEIISFRAQVKEQPATGSWCAIRILFLYRGNPSGQIPWTTVAIE